ncbi:MAG: polymerase sigma factor RpoE [Labilithrix sp.]|nr:polymerase sigma factor RpoE [Labilithrix sp.]
MGTPAQDQANGVEALAVDVSASGRAAEALSFRQIFDAHVSYVAATLARLGVDERDRDDLVSEVFVRVHRGLAAYDPLRPMKPWLFAFAARIASEHRRLARHRREVFEDVDVASSALGPDQALEQHEARRLLERALAELDDDKRAVFVLHDLDDTAVPEVARALGIPEGTAYSRLRAARAELAATVRRLQMTSTTKRAR